MSIDSKPLQIQSFIIKLFEAEEYWLRFFFVSILFVFFIVVVEQRGKLCALPSPPRKEREHCEKNRHFDESKERGQPRHCVAVHEHRVEEDDKQLAGHLHDERHNRERARVTQSKCFWWVKKKARFQWAKQWQWSLAATRCRRRARSLALTANLWHILCAH